MGLSFDSLFIRLSLSLRTRCFWYGCYIILIYISIGKCITVSIIIGIMLGL